MEILSRILYPYREQIGNVAGIVTLGQFLSGAFVLNDIRKKKSTDGFSVIPFLGGLILSLLNLKFGAILRDDAVIRINFAGIALNIIYILFYYYFTPNHGKTSVWAQIGAGGAFSVAILAYAEYEDPKLIEERFGLIITGFLIALVASPFLSLGDVIQKKSTASLPFPIILSGTAVSFMWLLYAIAINNSTIMAQNLIVLGICAAQLSLFVIYPSKDSTAIKSKKKRNKKQN